MIGATKLTPLPGAAEVTAEQVAEATAAVIEANLVRDWIRIQGRARGEL